jgi:hypothetical protein
MVAQCISALAALAAAPLSRDLRAKSRRCTLSQRAQFGACGPDFREAATPLSIGPSATLRSGEVAIA